MISLRLLRAIFQSFGVSLLSYIICYLVESTEFDSP